MKHESVQELFRRVAAAHPDRVAVERGPSRLTYAALDARSNRIANALLEAGASAPAPVAVFSGDPGEVIASILGVLKAGCAFVPLDPSFPEGRLSLMLAQSRAQLALAGAGQPDKLGRLTSGAGLRVVRLDGPEVGGAAEHSPAVDSDPDQMCSIYFTSGSTGRPKAIAGRLKGIDHFARWEAEALGVGVGTRVSQLASPSFDGFLKDAFVPLCAGGVVCAPEDRGVILEAGRLVDWVDVEGIEVLHVVPSVFRAMLGEGLKGEYFSELRYVVLAGEAVTPGDVGRWEEVFGGRVRLVNLYGPTETTVTKLYHFVTAEDAGRASVPIGRPMPGAAAMIMNPALQPCRPGAVGEIYIRTPYRALGYYGEPELTQEAFIPNPFGDDPNDVIYRTGDYGRLLEDGNFEYLGRRDQQVKVRGVRVELGELENLLRSHPSVADAAVIDLDDERGDKYLCAYYVPAGEATPTGLREYLAGRVPEFMLPSAYVELSELPRTLNGKIDRRALPTLEQARESRGEEGQAPRTPVEEIVCGVWAEVLRLSRVGPSDNFFELGGHSLLATRIVSRLREALGVELQLRDLFESPTAAGLAARVEEALKAGAGQQGPPLEPAPRDGELPLSYSQQRMWFLDQLSGGSSAYNIPLGMRLEGGLNVAVLEQTLGEVVRRHEVLRTTFPSVGGLPAQVISPARALTLPVVDLSHLPEGEREERARELATEDARRPFDLARGPLVRLLLLRLSGGEHVLLCTMHHLVSDGWSRGVIVRELSALYAAFSQGKPSPLPELPIQYADYAAWQREWLQGEVLEAKLGYWKNRLAQLPLMQLPTDRPRPQVQTSAGAVEPLRLARDVTDGLKALSQRAGATLFMTLLAAFKMLLSRYTGQEDVVVGTSVANRNRAEVEGLMGVFVNMLVLRTDVSGDPTCEELLGRVRETMLEAYAHQELPFEKLVEELQPRRSLSYSPLFQVAFTLQNAPLPELELGSLTLSFPEVEEVTAKYDLLMNVWETPDGLAGGLEYNTDLFDRGTAARMVSHFRTVLEGLAADPSRSLSELSLLTEPERLRAVGEWNATRADYPRDACIHELFEAQAEASPDGVALVFGGAQLTYGELNARANQAARHLKSLGVGPGQLVGLCMEHSAEEVVGLLAVLKAGAGYVPLDAEHPPRRLAYMMADAGVSVVLTQERFSEGFAAGGATAVRLDADWPAVAREDTANPPRAAAPASVAYVIYTSGSTGEPKGVAVSHESLVNYIWWARDVYLQGESLDFPLYSSLGFDLTVTSIYTALVTGNRLLVYRRKGKEPALQELLRENQSGVLKLTPGHLALIEGQDNRRSSIKRLIVGGEALTTKLARAVYDSFGGRVEIYNEYGPTEATVGCMIYKFDPEDGGRAFVPIGRPAANVQIYVLDRRLNPVAENVLGEIYISGDGLAQGYLNRSGLTAERFVPNPFADGRRMYRTGDLARRLPDGNLDFAGRADDQVKLRGFRIEPGEIEAALGRHQSVREAAVLLREDVPGDKRLVAYVVPEQGQTPASGELRRFLADALPAHMVPSAFLTLEALPMTRNGKLDRRALPEVGSERPDVVAAFVAPRTKMERAVAEVWREVLRIERVGIHDNFFELGGHSLLLVQVHSRLEDLFHRGSTVVDMFEYPTVSTVAKFLSGDDGGSQTESDEAGRAEKQRESRQRLTQRRRQMQQVPEEIS